MARSIIDEIKQTRPFRTKSQEATVALMRTAHLLRRHAEAVVGTEGLTFQQYNVLRILRGARGPLPTMEISSRMIEQSPGITRLVTTLEEHGFIKREQWAGDRRQFLCQITPAGQRVVEKLDPAMDELDDQTAGTLSAEKIEILLEVLADIRAHAAAPE
jgi:DNA-binding MarR family transcriptional regulator